MSVDLCEWETTYKFDYRDPNISDAPQQCRWPRPRKEVALPPPRWEYDQVDWETLKTRCVKVPFAFQWTPKPIVGTALAREFVVPEKPSVEEDRKRARMTRPQLYMTPAVAFDHAYRVTNDPQHLEVARTFPYTSTAQAMWNDSPSPKEEFPRRVPLTVIERSPDRVRYTGNPHKALPPGWQQAAKHWDTLQKRLLVDSTRDFWIKMAPKVKCVANEDELTGPMDQNIVNKAEELYRKHCLRQPYELKKPGYEGFVPQSVKGIPMEKKIMSPFDPMASCKQAVEARSASTELC